jgi:serine/threonine protein kinase
LAELGRAETHHPVAGNSGGHGLLLLERGDIVGRYVVLDQIGTGGMGVVYSAYDPELDRPIALKIIRSRGDADNGTGAQARLLREAQSLARLSDPHVVTVYDVQTVGSHVVVAMEYIHGVSLRTWLREQRPWRAVADVLARAGRGLQAAHRAGLVHRDFKPDNVMVGSDGEVRVLDFGLAHPTVDTDDRAATGKPAPTQTTASAVVGTPAYMAPEQKAGGPVDARTDQFSFCVVLYEALFDELPFLDQNHTRSRRPTPRIDPVPARIRRAIERGLATDPTQRWPTFDALLSELNRAPATQRRWLAAAVAVAAVAAVALVGSAQADPDPPADHQLAGIWNPDARRPMQASFNASGASFPAATNGSQNTAETDQHRLRNRRRKKNSAKCLTKCLTKK